MMTTTMMSAAGCEADNASIATSRTNRTNRTNFTNFTSRTTTTTTATTTTLLKGYSPPPQYAKPMTPEERQKWRELKRQLRLSSRGKTNAAVMQMLANMCRSEEGIVDQRTYQTTRKQHNYLNQHRSAGSQPQQQGRDITFWQKRFIRAAKTAASIASDDDDHEDVASKSNLFSSYAKQKYEPKHKQEEKKALTFSENIQDMLLKMTAQFGEQINDAYQTDPATETDANTTENEGGNDDDGAKNPLAALQKMQQIDENMRAIDQDMQILNRTKNQGHTTATDFFVGFAELGEGDYLSEVSSSESGSGLDSSESGSESLSSSDDDDDDEDSESDDDDSSIGSYGSLMKELEGGRMGIVVPGSGVPQYDHTDDEYGARTMAAPVQLLPSVPPSPNVTAAAVSPVPILLLPPPPQQQSLDDKNEDNYDTDSDGGSQSDSSDDDDSDLDSDSSDDSELDEDFLNEMAAKMGIIATATMPPLPPPTTTPANPSASVMGEVAVSNGAAVANPLAAILAGCNGAPPKPVPTTQLKRKDAQQAITSGEGKEETEELESKQPSVEAWASEGLGMDVRAFDRTGMPNEKAAKHFVHTAPFHSIAQANDDDITSDLNIAATLAAQHDEEVLRKESPKPVKPIRNGLISSCDDLNDSVVIAERTVFASCDSLESLDRGKSIVEREEAAVKEAAQCSYPKIPVRGLMDVTVNLERKGERTSMLISYQECHAAVNQHARREEIDVTEIRGKKRSDRNQAVVEEREVEEEEEVEVATEPIQSRAQTLRRRLSKRLSRKLSLLVGWNTDDDDDDDENEAHNGSDLLVGWGEEATESDNEADPNHFRVRTWFKLVESKSSLEAPADGNLFSIASKSAQGSRSRTHHSTSSEKQGGDEDNRRTVHSHRHLHRASSAKTSLRPDESRGRSEDAGLPHSERKGRKHEPKRAMSTGSLLKKRRNHTEKAGGRNKHHLQSSNRKGHHPHSGGRSGDHQSDPTSSDSHKPHQNSYTRQSLTRMQLRQLFKSSEKSEDPTFENAFQELVPTNEHHDRKIGRNSLIKELLGNFLHTNERKTPHVGAAIHDSAPSSDAAVISGLSPASTATGPNDERVLPKVVLPVKKKKKSKKKNLEENSLDTRRRRKIRQGQKRKEVDEFFSGLRVVDRQHGREVCSVMLSET